MLLRILFLIIVGVVMPLLAIQSERKLRTIRPFPPREQIWSSVLVTQFALLCVALVTWWRGGYDLFPAYAFEPGHILAALGLLALALSLLPLGGRFISRKHLSRLLKLGPRSRRDLGWWGAISLTAGVVEEFVYRGLLTAILVLYIGDFWLAALLSALIFAITHAVQGIMGAIVIFFFALGFQWLAEYTGTLLYSMAVHAIYDFAAGLYLAFVLRPRHPELADEAAAPEPEPAPPAT